MDNLVTEIRSFYSLKELSENIDEEIDFYKAAADEYSQRLGSFLREMESIHGNEEWFKKLPDLQKTSKRSKSKKKKAGSSGWIEFEEMMLSTEKQGEAQILFEAIEEINSKVMRLSKISDTIEDLKKLGLGEDILYITYMHDEVPERIVLRKKGGREAGDKFEFMTTFHLSKDL